MNIEKHKEQIIKKFEEIDYKDGLILIENIINNNHNDILLKDIIVSLSKNKKKYTYEIYEYIIKNTKIDYESIINTEYIEQNNLFIHICTFYGNVNLLNYLIKKCVNINSKNYYGGETALILASRYSNYKSSNETVKLLLENGADVNLQDNNGFTALMLASQYSNDSSSYETVKLLLENNADLNLQNCCGETAVMLASWHSDYRSSSETVKLLLENGADVDFQNNRKYTAYDLAPTNKCKNLIKSYIQN